MVTSVRSNRSWLGVDVSEEYCKIARHRIEVSDSGTQGPHLDDESVSFANELAAALASGAQAAGHLEVRRFHVTKNGPWEPYRRTLSNHASVGAYAVVRRDDGSRVAWTTSHGRAQLLTLRRWSRKPVKTIAARNIPDLEAAVFDDAVRAMVNASADRRGRAISIRGFDQPQ